VTVFGNSTQECSTVLENTVENALMAQQTVFGAWTTDVASLANAFSNAKPFEHVVIRNFFSEEVAEQLLEHFPHPTKSNAPWHHYDNPIEQKYSLDDFTNIPTIQAIFERLQSQETISLFRRVTGIDSLEADPHLHGAGLHAYPNRGKLDMHLDYCIHPISGKERRCNLIVYLNKGWKSEYGGDLELWDEKLTHKTSLVTPGWNTAIIFKTNDVSYHGLPRAINCPEGTFRKSLALYYVSPQTASALPRHKAEFHPTPEQQPCDERLLNLYEVRVHRRLTIEDFNNWPTWREDGGEFW